MKHLSIAHESIDDFHVDESGYKSDLIVENLTSQGNGKVFLRSEEISAKIMVNFRSTSGCKLFIGSNIQGNITINFRGDNSLIYIGNQCRLNDLQIRSFQNNDFIAIGNQVTTTASNVWISGNGAGESDPAIIIGDDCMFAYDIVLRNSDAHPIFSFDTEEQINEPNGIIHIEPHVWIGERVSILKNVTVGACSIVGLGSIVTKDVPRFSIARGNPAVSELKPDIYWSRNSGDVARTEAKSFVQRYTISKNGKSSKTKHRLLAKLRDYYASSFSKTFERW